MIGDLISMDWVGYSGGTIGNLLAEWEQAGVFSYVLPFLIIFALIFGILSQMKLFKSNRAVNSIIALAVGLMALQFDFVPRFFAEVFPRLGIGLAIILIFLIFLGLFIDPDKSWLMYGLMGIGFVIIVVVLVSTAGVLGWSFGYLWQENYKTIIFLIGFLVLVGLIIGSTNKNNGGGGGGENPYKAFMVRDNND